MKVVASLSLVLGMGTLSCNPGEEAFTCEEGLAGVDSASSSGAACDSRIHDEGCLHDRRMRCENGLWKIAEICAEKMTCVAAVRPDSKVFLRTRCCPVDSTFPSQDTQGGPADGEGSEAGTNPGVDADDPVCKRWLSDRADLSEGSYDGADFSTCDPGGWSGKGHENSLRLINLYRFLAHLPDLSSTPELDAKAQACAFLMAANDKLSHTPPKSWNCYSDVAALAASKSNVSNAAAVRAIDGYMVDDGEHNKMGLGHRRWLLSSRAGPVGIGSTGETKNGHGQASCVWVVGEGKNDRTWITWPPAGKVPLEALAPRGVSVDSTGWSITSETVDPSQGKIKVSAGGQALSIYEWRTLTPLLGSNYGLAFQPNGWTVEAGETYTVELTDVSEPFKWSFTVLDCEH